MAFGRAEGHISYQWRDVVVWLWQRRIHKSKYTGMAGLTNIQRFPRTVVEWQTRNILRTGRLLEVRHLTRRVRENTCWLFSWTRRLCRHWIDFDSRSRLNLAAVFRSAASGTILRPMLKRSCFITCRSVWGEGVGLHATAAKLTSEKYYGCSNLSKCSKESLCIARMARWGEVSSHRKTLATHAVGVG